jgi:plasmid stabilization system protein ParE
MSRHYQLTPLAEQDARDIVLYVAERFGVERAERARLQFVSAFRPLAERPEMARDRPELWPEPYRFWPLGPALIAYRGDVSPIQVVRVARASEPPRVLRRLG